MKINSTDKFNSLYDYELIKQILFPIFGNISLAQWEELKKLIIWVEIAGGEQLISQGDISDSVYFLVHGRLTAIHEDLNGVMHPLGDVVQGQSVGEIGFFTEEKRTAHVFSNRDSVLIKINSDTMLKTLGLFPDLTLQIMKTVMTRASSQYIQKKQPSKVKNIAFLASDNNSRAKDFVLKINQALSQVSSVLLLQTENLEQILDISPSAISNKDQQQIIKLLQGLEKLEQTYDFVLFFAHEEEKDWMQVIIRQSDIFYLLKNKEESPELSETEKLIFDELSFYRFKEKHLIILHPDGSERPMDTNRFLKHRKIDLHHHIRMDNPGDFSRIVRFLRGKTTGIALSGGGAKGMCFAGVITGARNKGLPIDFIAGTSVGAIAGAFAALDLDNEALYQEAKNMSFRAPTRRKNLNVLPLFSLMKGRDLDDVMESIYGDMNIEDTWINFACVASNMSTYRTEVFTSGKLKDAVRASISLPGIFPPAVKDNDLLIDGGVLDNLPIDILIQKKIAKKIVVTINKTKKYNLGYDKIPGVRAFFYNKFKGKRQAIPGIMTVIMESMVLASYSKYPEAIQQADLHLHPPMDKIGLLDWLKYDEAFKIGMEYTEEILTQELVEGLLA